ncbi:MAG TPA: hypothetical protein VFK06_08105 [Candidatus Angelobacter sp.]|nr:hypothetical protein [Candidatus Angelobacter sp.]
MMFPGKIAAFVLLLAALCAAQTPAKSTAGSPAEDISGMYNFLKAGEFVQITVESSGVSGYISRQGDLESDRGTFLDQFFSSASIEGHNVAFVTKQVHGVWFEFKGRFDRGKAKDKSEDGYYVLRGTLTEFTVDSSKQTTSRSRSVEFSLLGQPADDAPAKPKSSDAAHSPAPL